MYLRNLLTHEISGMEAMHQKVSTGPVTLSYQFTTSKKHRNGVLGRKKD